VLKAIKALSYGRAGRRGVVPPAVDMLAVIFPEMRGVLHGSVAGIDEVAAEHNFHLTTAFAHGSEMSTRWHAGAARSSGLPGC